jgi:hypothetical protein
MNRTSLTVLVASLGIVLLTSAAVGELIPDMDAEIESCLTEGKILKGVKELTGVTRPLKVEVECGGTKREAIFKSLDEKRMGATKLAGGKTEFNFTDSFRYERAAYVLDRQLGLNMVPVAVLQRRKGADGVLVDFIPDTVHENQVSTPFRGPQMAALTRQKSRMHLFDSLIYNTDRRAENMLIDESTGKLYLIDHSRAFREQKELQDIFAQGRVWLSREMYDNLVALNKENLASLLEDVISKAQLEAILARRDLIVAKIDQDRQEYGDDSVFLSADQ